MKLGEAMRIAKTMDWIRPRYAAYLAGPRNVEAERNHMHRLLGIPERDRTQSWAASGAGKCLRQRQFAYLGMDGKTPDEHGLNIFLNGTYVHLRHQVVGLSAGYLRDAEVPVTLPELNLVGTMDALDTKGIPVEYKSINQNGFGSVRAFGPKAEHRHQIHSYMLASGTDAFRVVYENKNTNDLLEFFVDRDENEVAAVRDDLEMLNEATDNRTLLPMLEECTKKEGAYRWCPFASSCPKMSYPAVQARSVILRMSSSASDSPRSLSPQVFQTYQRFWESSTSTGTSSSDE
jgi:hypothetical protein